MLVSLQLMDGGNVFVNPDYVVAVKGCRASVGMTPAHTIITLSDGDTHRLLYGDPATVRSMLDSAKAGETNPDEDNQRLRCLLLAAGVCPECEEEIEHDGNEPFAHCGCSGTMEWTAPPPTIWRLRRQYQFLQHLNPVIRPHSDHPTAVAAVIALDTMAEVWDKFGWPADIPVSRAVKRAFKHLCGDQQTYRGVVLREAAGDKAWLRVSTPDPAYAHRGVEINTRAIAEPLPPMGKAPT